MKVLSPFGPKMAQLKFNKSLINKMNKEAVVFIVDANLTMNLPYPPPQSPKDGGAGESNSSTRLSQAKDAVLTSIIDLMWRSKTHEAGVVVLKAGVTHHHLSEIERITDDVDVGKTDYHNILCFSRTINFVNVHIVCIQTHTYTSYYIHIYHLR